MCLLSPTCLALNPNATFRPNLILAFFPPPPGSKQQTGPELSQYWAACPLFAFAHLEGMSHIKCWAKRQPDLYTNDCSFHQRWQVCSENSLNISYPPPPLKCILLNGYPTPLQWKSCTQVNRFEQTALICVHCAKSALLILFRAQVKSKTIPSPLIPINWIIIIHTKCDNYATSHQLTSPETYFTNQRKNLQYFW